MKFIEVHNDTGAIEFVEDVGIKVKSLKSYIAISRIELTNFIYCCNYTIDTIKDILKHYKLKQTKPKIVAICEKAIKKHKTLQSELSKHIEQINVMRQQRNELDFDTIEEKLAQKQVPLLPGGLNNKYDLNTVWVHL